MKVGTDAMLLGASVEADNPGKILDIGAGTGVIALMLAQQFPRSELTAIEIDDLSAKECDHNFKNSAWSDRLQVFQGDFMEHEFFRSFDLIVSNPPYYQTRLENNDARTSQARHEFALPMQAMLKKVARLLENAGSFWVIIPSEIAERWREAANSHGLFVASEIHIYGKEQGPVKRVIFGFGKEVVTVQKTSLTIRRIEGTYTDEYVELTKTFHYNKLR